MSHTGPSLNPSQINLSVSCRTPKQNPKRTYHVTQFLHEIMSPLFIFFFTQSLSVSRVTYIHCLEFIDIQGIDSSEMNFSKCYCRNCDQEHCITEEIQNSIRLKISPIQN